MTAARRSGGRPPSHSHWSITFGHTRSVTAAASCGEGFSTFGKVSGAADPDPHLVRADAPALADRLGPDHGQRHDRRAGLQRQAADAALGAAERAGPDARALGEDQHAVAAVEDRPRGLQHVAVAGAPVDGEGAERVAGTSATSRCRKSSSLGDVVERPAGDRPDHERVEERAVVGGEDHRPRRRDVLAPDPRHPPVEVRERLEHRAGEPVDDRIDAALAGARVQAAEVGSCRSSLPHMRAVPGRRAARYSCFAMAFDRTRTLRGALAGSVGAAVWLAQQPLDRRVFGYDHDDAELLGRLVARGRPEAPAIGAAAAPAERRRCSAPSTRNLAPSLPVPPVLRGPLAGLLEHVVTWPAIAIVEPSMLRSGRAFAQSAWRHVLFGPCSASSSGGSTRRPPSSSRSTRRRSPRTATAPPRTWCGTRLAAARASRAAPAPARTAAPRRARGRSPRS